MQVLASQVHFLAAELAVPLFPKLYKNIDYVSKKFQSVKKFLICSLNTKGLRRREK